MAVFRAYTEMRRALAVSSAFKDLAIDVAIASMYKPRGLRQRTFLRRIIAGTLRRIFRRGKNFATFPVQFRRTLERLGPTYVKLGQILSLRDDMLPERITKELRKLQSQVPPIAYEDVKAVIESEFNVPLKSIYKEFEEKPVAAASLAQAHIATLQNGRRVVVKVQRPGILKLIIDDINVMRRLARLLERIPGLREYRPVHFVEEFASYTMRELDFTQEGKHADIFRENFKEERDIIFPGIFWDFTSRRVLTMEFIDGIKPDDAQKLKRMGIDGKALAARGAQAVIKMLFLDGFFHGDPHPGNLFIVDRQKLCFIDLGMIGSFSPETRQNMFLYYYFMVIKEFEHATKYLVNLTVPGYDADIKGFRKDLAEEIKNWSGAGFKDYSLGRLIFETMNIGARHKLYFHGDLVLSSKTIITIEAVGAILDPHMDLSIVSQPMMEKIFAEQFSPVRYTRALLKALPDYLDFIEDIPKNLLNTVSMISSGKFQIELTEPEERKEQKESLPMFPVLSAASIIAAAFFSVSENTPGPVIDSIPLLSGMPLLAALSFVAGAIFAWGAWRGKKRAAVKI